ncbi:IS30 family transposase [Arthrobacter sp. CAN_A214]
MYSYPPIADFSRPQVSSPRYLSEEERIRIADLIRAGSSIRATAVALGRSPSTISRELRRNAAVSGRYTPHRAHQQARQRRLRARPGKIVATPALREQIQELLKRRWSPAQISWYLKTTFPEDTQMHVVPETIYRDLYNWQGGALTRDYCALLRRRHLHRKPSRKVPKRRARFSGDVLMIGDRPFPPEDRSTPGQWEGDLIMGRNNRSAIATLVERHSRFVILLPVDPVNKAASVQQMITAAMLKLPAHLRRSLTWDQGWEMARHTEITQATGMAIYFCEPRSPWQRGSNENANGLLRDYFPKGSNLTLHSLEYLAAVAIELNTRPRRTLGWDTPANLFAKLFETTIST